MTNTKITLNALFLPNDDFITTQPDFSDFEREILKELSPANENRTPNINPDNYKKIFKDHEYAYYAIDMLGLSQSSQLILDISFVENHNKEDTISFYETVIIPALVAVSEASKKVKISQIKIEESITTCEEIFFQRF